MELVATHFGLTIEPPVVPPGGSFVLRYRAVNHGAVPAPPATVAFLIDPAMVDDLPPIVDLGSLAPGAVRDVGATVRLSPQVRNGARVRVQAALTAGSADPIGSNPAELEVRGTAILAAPPSRLVLRSAASGYVVDALIANTGDAASAETHLVVELPAGMRASGGGTRIDYAVPPLEPGASAPASFPVVIDGIPALPLQILDAALVGGGRRVSLAPSEPLLPPLEASAVTIALERTGRRVDARVRIENPNLCALHDLVLEAAWPRSLRLADGSVIVDGRMPLRAGARGAAATLKTTASGATITLARIAPRAVADLCFSAFAAPSASGEVTIVLHTGDRESAARAVFAAQPAGGPVLALGAGTAAAVAGAELTAEAFLWGGDEPCNLSFRSDDPALRVVVDGTPLAADAAIALAAGTRRDVAVIIPVDERCADGTRLERRVCATSDRGEATELSVAFTVRSRAWLDVTEWLVPGDDGPRLTIANAGSTPASGVRVDAANGPSLVLGTIAPGERVTRTIDGQDASAFAAGARVQHAGAVEPIVIPPLRTATPDRCATVALDVPHDAHEGIAFDVRWTVTVPGGASTLVVRCPEHAGLFIVPGSTAIDGHPIVDGPTPRIASGIALHAVPAQTCIAFTARGIARAPGTIALAIATAIDGAEERITSDDVHVVARAAFPQKPDGLRFYLDAPALDAPAPAERPDVSGAEEPHAPLDDARRALLERALQRAGIDPIADALGVLAALMPDGAPRDEFGENAERLSVKLRIPGYVAEADDYESVAARHALDRARGEAGSGPLTVPRGSAAALAVWCATIDPHAAPGLPLTAYLRAFVQFAAERQPGDRDAFEAARDAVRAALAVAA
jgi:hypothetical protein